MRKLTNTELQAVSGGAGVMLKGIYWALQQVPEKSTAYEILSRKIMPGPKPVPAPAA
jgi:bacteriocin-like protein